MSLGSLRFGWFGVSFARVSGAMSGGGPGGFVSAALHPERSNMPSANDSQEKGGRILPT